MRGGAIPLLCWALLLALSGTLNAIWTGDTIQIGTFAAAVLAIVLLAAALAVRAPESLRRGEPGRRSGREAITHASFGAALTAVGLAVLLFGFVFGHFPIYFGAGMVVVGLSRVLLEQRAQRRSRP